MERDESTSVQFCFRKDGAALAGDRNGLSELVKLPFFCAGPKQRRCRDCHNEIPDRLLQADSSREKGLGFHLHSTGEFGLGPASIRVRKALQKHCTWPWLFSAPQCNVEE